MQADSKYLGSIRSLPALRNFIACPGGVTEATKLCDPGHSAFQFFCVCKEVCGMIWLVQQVGASRDGRRKDHENPSLIHGKP